MKKSFKQRLCDTDKKGMIFPLLPSSFKWIGILIAVLAIVAMLLVRYSGVEQMEFYKDMAKHVILIGLFLIVLTREKEEDERIVQLRYRAFAFSFVLMTITLLLIPFIIILFDSLMGNFPLEWENQSIFFIMTYYLSMYLTYFQSFKKSL